MVKVVVAGGTGGIGLHIAEALVATGKHDVLVFSRSADAPHITALGAQLVTVDYADIPALAQALAGVHTVISTINSPGETFKTTTQLALLEAAVQAGVRRFAPSEFGIYVPPETTHAPAKAFYRLKAPVAEAVARSGLEYTLFENGVFMNYLATGTRGLGHLKPIPFLLDFEKGTATVPGDGRAHVVFTAVEDVGRFVAASVDLEKWPAVSEMKGDRKTLNEVVAIAEAVRGHKFEVTYISEQQLEQQLAEINSKTEGWSFERLYVQYLLTLIQTDLLAHESANLNDACPHIQPMDVEGFMRKWWGKKE